MDDFGNDNESHDSDEIKMPSYSWNEAKVLTIKEPVDCDQLKQILTSGEFVSTDVEELNFAYEYSDDIAVLDFVGFDDLLVGVTNLGFNCCQLGNFVFKSDKLECLTIDHKSVTGQFNLTAPYLRFADFNYIMIEDPKGWGESFSRSPCLKSLSSYKLWGLGHDLPSLYLPSCESLDFYRADDLSKLHVYAPKLTDLCLRACYSMSSIKFLARGKREHREFNRKRGQPFSKMRVEVINACFSRASRRYLKEHGRVKKISWQCNHDGYPLDVDSFGGIHSDDAGMQNGREIGDDRENWTSGGEGDCVLM